MFASAPVRPRAYPVRSLPLLLGGDPQTRITLRVMRDLVQRALRDPAVLQVAADVVHGIDGHRVDAQLVVLRRWLAAHVQFLQDPAIDGDVLRTPSYLLDQFQRTGVIRADCDDAAMLSAAFGKAIGIPARFRAIAFEPGPFRHVYAELQTPDGTWHEFDVTESPERRAQFPAVRSMVQEV